MKILLVYPQCQDTFWNLKYALPFISRETVLPPLGLMTVAALLPEQWEKKFVDMSVDELADEDILWADYVFISAMFIQRKYAEKLVERCNTLSTKIVAGGPLFTEIPESFDNVDHLVLNEAEVTLPAFLKDLESGWPNHIYQSKDYPNITSSPTPLWELIDMRKYASMAIQYSRGCPFNCNFCDITYLFGNKTRTKTTIQILDELESLYNQGWREAVFIVDDNFIGGKSKLRKELLPAMIEWMRQRDYPFIFNTQVSINIADDEELMQMMVQAGFEAVFIGIETLDDKSFEECCKGQNKRRDLIANVKKIQQHGLQVQAGFILGFDNDRSTIFDRMIDFIQKSGIVTAMVGLLHAPRNSELYKHLYKENRLLDYSSGDSMDLSMNFIPKMDSEELLEGYKRVVRTVYSYSHYHDRIITLLKNYRLPLKRKSQTKISDIKTILKSTWFLGLREEGKIYYWKLFLWTLFRKPQFLRQALTFAIHGFHFRKYFSNP